MGREVIIIMTLALCVSSGLFLMAAACISAESMWPTLSLALCLGALTPLFCCNLAEATLEEGGLPSHLRDHGDEGTPASDVGWLVVGAFITGALSCPLVLARHGIVDMRSSWMASGGTWCTVLALSIGGILLFKGQTR